MDILKEFKEKAEQTAAYCLKEIQQDAEIYDFESDLFLDEVIKIMRAKQKDGDR